MRRRKPISHVAGFDDAPFEKDHRGDVVVVGSVFARERLDGVLTGRVRRDGANAAREIVRMIQQSRFEPQIQLVMLQGIALAGFNVVDVFAMHAALARPVLVVARHAPDMDAIRRALLENVRGGRRKWDLIARIGPMEPYGEIWAQRIGIDERETEDVLDRFSIHSNVPEPLRTAHIIAGGMVNGESRGRV
jgi:endonuclease V-like protein UPF0215 family